MLDRAQVPGLHLPHPHEDGGHRPMFRTPLLNTNDEILPRMAGIDLGRTLEITCFSDSQLFFVFQ
jgi:hypothetical protein